LENDKENYILCIGRLVPVKAFNYAIEAFARIIVDNPFLRLKILGQGILEKELKQQTKDLNISDKVDFEGYHKDIIPYYLHARLTVLTSLYEGFGCVLNEPIALGTPVVAFDCSGGPKEVIQSGVNGYLVRYKDVDHLTECIKLALNRQWDTKTIRATAGRFSSERIIDEYARVLASVACYQ
jgi:glycosyltransferase involved in cell wall biosynthesis